MSSVKRKDGTDSNSSEDKSVQKFSRPYEHALLNVSSLIGLVFAS